MPRIRVQIEFTVDVAASERFVDTLIRLQKWINEPNAPRPAIGNANIVEAERLNGGT